MNVFSYQKKKSQKHIKRRHTPPQVAGHLPPVSTHGRQRPVGRAEERGSDAPVAGAIASAVFALPITVGVGFLCLLAATLLSYRQADPHALILPLSLVALGLTSLLGGLVAARRGRGNPLLGGLFCGILLNLVMLLLSLFWGEGDKSALSLGFSSLTVWGLRAGVVILSLIGAKIGAGRNAGRR